MTPVAPAHHHGRPAIDDVFHRHLMTSAALCRQAFIPACGVTGFTLHRLVVPRQRKCRAIVVDRPSGRPVAPPLRDGPPPQRDEERDHEYRNRCRFIHNVVLYTHVPMPVRITGPWGIFASGIPFAVSRFGGTSPLWDRIDTVKNGGTITKGVSRQPQRNRRSTIFRQFGVSLVPIYWRACV